METLLKAKNLSKEYIKTQGFFSRTRTSIKALDNVSVSIKKGITLKSSFIFVVLKIRILEIY
jgi:ABC-type oligopeptide transport system ATPase subunit